MKRILLILLVNCITSLSFGQYNSDDISKVHTTPPTLSGLGEYIDIPVGLFTGVPDITIPLYTAQVGRYKLPVTLSYHASGIKVQQRASWVGLGWSLNAGGVITHSRQANVYINHIFR